MGSQVAPTLTPHVGRACSPPCTHWSVALASLLPKPLPRHDHSLCLSEGMSLCS